MENIAYLMDRSKRDYFEIIKWPYFIFLSLLKHFRLIDLKSTPEGRELLEKSKRLFNTKADLNRIRTLTGYKKG